MLALSQDRRTLDTSTHRAWLFPGRLNTTRAAFKGMGQCLLLWSFYFLKASQRKPTPLKFRVVLAGEGSLAILDLGLYSPI